MTCTSSAMKRRKGNKKSLVGKLTPDRETVSGNFSMLDTFILEFFLEMGGVFRFLSLSVYRFVVPHPLCWLVWPHLCKF